MSKGYINDYRKELESDIWLMPPLYHRVWQWIKYSVSHSKKTIPNKDGTFTKLEPGQWITSYRNIAKGVGYYEGKKWKEPNVKTIREILEWLTKQEMIRVCSNTLGTTITVANWGLYQEKESKGNTKRITEQTSAESTFEALWKLYPRKEGKGKISKSQKEKLNQVGLEEMTRAVERYTKAKQGEEKKYLQHGSTFFNSGYVDYLDENYQSEPSKGSGLRKVEIDW